MKRDLGAIATASIFSIIVRLDIRFFLSKFHADSPVDSIRQHFRIFPCVEFFVRERQISSFTESPAFFAGEDSHVSVAAKFLPPDAHDVLNHDRLPTSTGRLSKVIPGY